MTAERACSGKIPDSYVSADRGSGATPGGVYNGRTASRLHVFPSRLPVIGEQGQAMSGKIWPKKGPATLRGQLRGRFLAPERV